MRVLDGAVIVWMPSGVSNLRRRRWRASRFNIPRVIFVNKMDRPGADFENAMDTLAKRLKGNPIPVCVPVDEAVVNGRPDRHHLLRRPWLRGHCCADHG